jgi:large subunit ribosomal protein L25
MSTLEITKREDGSNLSDIRKQGSIPAVFYGRKQPSTSISIKLKDFEKIFKSDGESSVITLSGEGIPNIDVMIHDVNRDPISNLPIHVDFYAIEKDKKIKYHVPVEFNGVAPAVKEHGGILVKVLHEIEIEALPQDLIHVVNVDISSLVDFDSQITADSIILPKNVTLITKGDEIVASVSRPKEEKEEVAPADISSIEVEKKGKEVKEGDSAEAKE